MIFRRRETSPPESQPQQSPQNGVIWIQHHDLGLGYDWVTRAFFHDTLVPGSSAYRQLLRDLRTVPGFIHGRTYLHYVAVQWTQRESKKHIPRDTVKDALLKHLDAYFASLPESKRPLPPSQRAVEYFLNYQDLRDADPDGKWRLGQNFLNEVSPPRKA